MTTGVLGIPLDRFDRRLRAATADLRAILLPAHEQGAEKVEPSHIFLALARIPGGLTELELTERLVPVDVLGEALRDANESGGSTMVEALDETTVSPAAAAVFAALHRHVGDGGSVGERELLAQVLAHIEPSVAEMLHRLARIDTDAWAAALLVPPPPPPEPFSENGGLNAAAFSTGALRAFATLSREAGALGHERLSTALLLQAMTVMPDGLIEQGLYFLQQDVRAIRERLLSVVGARRGAAVDALPLIKTNVAPGLDLLLGRASAIATSRHAAIGERDLLMAMLDTPGGIASSFFRDVDVNVQGLLKFAQDYYREPAPQSEVAPPVAGVPVAQVAERFRLQLVGQEAVVDRLIPHVRRIKMGLALDYRRDANPSAALLFCGPSGTGKTMTARVLAELIYGSQDDVLMFEMGQFNSRESINNFIGAPPGYVGFGEGKLTNGLRDNPRRVLLFDEVEKADARVFDALLRLLDEGRISDPAGPVRDARESVIVLTSNIGSKELASVPAAQAAQAEAPKAEPAPEPTAVRGEMARIFAESAARKAGSGADAPPTSTPKPASPASSANGAVPAEDPRAARARLRGLLEQFFRPEFLNRVDEILVFQSFGPDQLRDIAAATLAAEREKAARKLGVSLSWEDDLPGFLATQAALWRPDEAARGVNRLVTDIVPMMLEVVFEAREAGRAISRLRIRVTGDTLGIEEPDDD